MKRTVTARELNELGNFLRTAGKTDMADMFHRQVLKMVQNKIPSIVLDNESGTEDEKKQIIILFEYLDTAKECSKLRNQMKR